MHKKVIVASLLSSVLLVASSVSAQTATPPQSQKWSRGGAYHGTMQRGQGVAGKVTALNGATITVTDQKGATHTVDATNAKVMKGGTSGQLSDVTVGAMIFANGTVSGSTVAATSIRLMNGTMERAKKLLPKNGVKSAVRSDQKSTTSKQDVKKQTVSKHPFQKWNGEQLKKKPSAPPKTN